MIRRLLTNWYVATALLAITVILAVALWPESITVDVDRAVRGPLQVTIDEEGETRVRERFVISAPVAGRVHRIELEPGDPVRRGEVLVRIAPAPPALLDPRSQAELSAAAQAASAALGAARAEREKTEATLARAKTLLQRQETLATGGAISRDELDAAQTSVKLSEEALHAAEFTVARAQHDLEMARARLQQPRSGGRPVEIVSPVNGVTLKRLHESETVVAAGEPLLELGDPGDLEIVADLLSADAVRVPPNARVLIEQWGGPAVLKGRVTRVEPSGFVKVSALGVEEQRVNVRIEFADPSTAALALGEGYRVEIRIVVWEQTDVVKVPVASLFRVGEAWAVFAIDGNRVRSQVVGVGERNAAEAQVLNGLAEGQAVVLYPPDMLKDGSRIVAR